MTMRANVCVSAGRDARAVLPTDGILRPSAAFLPPRLANARRSL
jgi:hypothetical protein